MTIDQFRAHLTKTLDADRIPYSAGDNTPSEDFIAAAEMRTGFRLPDEYRAFLLAFGGAQLEALEEVWPRGEYHRIGPFLDLQLRIHDLWRRGRHPGYARSRGGDAGIPAREDQLPVPQLPVFRQEIGNGDRVCLDAKGRLFKCPLYHAEDLEPISGTFLKFLARTATELVNDKNEMLRMKDGPPS